ncbi:MAG TPA: DNA mismatch repair protein MutL, partial [Acidobacteriota bacterium]|nr:DNA mismatch repair protein MutL [Acidobacteriota bacterium]
GFEVEWFGETTLLVRGVPAVSPQLSAGDVLHNLLDEMAARDDIPAQGDADDRFLKSFRKQLAVSLACRAAVKVNTPLSEAKMEWMVNELLACRNPYTCPHGRPVVLKLTLEELLKAFHRI